MSFTEVSEVLDWTIARKGSRRVRSGALRQHFLDLEKSCCCSCRFGQGPRWPMLTLVVSLQAMFLSASVMIGQNRPSSFQQAKANHDFKEQELELNQHAADSRDPYATTEAHDRLLNGVR